MIEPTGPIDPAGGTIRVIGSGFDAAANGGVGVYVVFGPLTPAPTYYTDALLYDDAVWVHQGASSTPGQGVMAADGSFDVSLDVAASFVDGHDAQVDCLSVGCHVITMAAHGVDDRSQDTFTAVSFLPAASASPSPSGSASPGAPSPQAEPSTAASPTAAPPTVEPTPSLTPSPTAAIEVTAQPSANPSPAPVPAEATDGVNLSATIGAGLALSVAGLAALLFLRRRRA